MEKEKIAILLDNGHGSNTPGKCSPDGKLREYAYARKVVNAVCDELMERGYTVKIITPEEWDVKLGTRCNRVNKLCMNKSRNYLLVSVHCDAAGADGKWHEANGWSVRVGTNASNNSKKLAACLLEQAKKNGLMGNRYIPTAGYWVQNLAICRDTKCPAVLTENMFQDNRGDVDLLLSEDGFRKIVSVHVEGIEEYVRKL